MHKALCMGKNTFYFKSQVGLYWILGPVAIVTPHLKFLDPENGEIIVRFALKVALTSNEIMGIKVFCKLYKRAYGCALNNNNNKNLSRVLNGL